MRSPCPDPYLDLYPNQILLGGGVQSLTVLVMKNLLIRSTLTKRYIDTIMSVMNDVMLRDA